RLTIGMSKPPDHTRPWSSLVKFVKLWFALCPFVNAVANSQYRQAVASGLRSIEALLWEGDPMLPRVGTDCLVLRVISSER
ncbi:MAG TPA: hypothetical protein VF251_11545, partial [Pyrinomonadaceae bacterium]